MAGQTSWPEGVVARYLTVGGATVDLRHDMHLVTDTEPNETVAKCTACGTHHLQQWALYTTIRSNGSAGADAEARNWAQGHAETCRAMLKPDAP